MSVLIIQRTDDTWNILFGILWDFFGFNAIPGLLEVFFQFDLFVNRNFSQFIK